MTAPLEACGGCGGKHVPGPIAMTYLHKPHCPALANGMPVSVLCGDTQYHLGAVVAPEDGDPSYVLALFLRAAGTAWLEQLQPQVNLTSVAPMPEQVYGLAAELLTAGGEQEAANTAFRLGLALSDWLGGPDA